MQKTISVNFRATPIDDVIRTFADQGGIDIVKSPEVVGDVTALINSAPLGEAMNNILAAHGYGYLESQNMLRIVPLEVVQLEKQKQLSKVYRITYADVKELHTALEKFLSAEGKLSSNPGTSNIIVTDTEAKIAAIDLFIAEIDRITPQIMVEARIYDIASTDQLDLGIEWFAGRTTAFDPVTGKPIAGAAEPFLQSEFDSAISRTTKTTAGMLQFGFFNESIDIDAVLTAKQDKICAKLLANPRILVLDNETALIKIVSELPYQELTQTAGGGNIGTTAFKDVGVELEVTPHLTREGMVRLKLRPKFSVQTDSVAIAIPGATAPILFPQPVVDSREAITTALIENNQTVVIGGLRKKDSITETSKVPLLGDIPLLGALFTFKGEKLVNSELVVFITPRLVERPLLSEAESHYLTTFNAETCAPVCPPALVESCGPQP
jgi:type IV pilus assembly protein PilQ